MADYIFTEGKIAKKNFFNKLIEILTAAGWANVSSNPTTDFVVMHSKGESGDKDLFIQLRSTNNSNANPIDSTDYSVMSYRFVEGYTPGTGGAAGTFTRSNETWVALHLVPSAIATQLNQELELTYFYHVNKNRIIISIETPVSTSLAPVIVYLGLPDVLYTDEPGSRGLVCATSCYPRTNNTIHVSNAAHPLPSDTTSSTRTIYVTLSPKNPNTAGLYTISEMTYGNVAEGTRAKLTGLYQLPNGNINNGDFIEIDAKLYRIVVTHVVASSSSFSSSTFALQVE